jgi:ATP-dependent helicase IRC3
MMRPYQVECLAATLKDYRAGNRSLLWNLGTGAGKTVLAAGIPRLLRQQRGEKTLFLVPLDDLAWQAKAKFEAINPGMLVGIEKAEYRASPMDDIVIASIQTLGRTSSSGYGARLCQFDSAAVRNVIVDECDLAVSESYLRVFRYFGVLRGEEGFDKSKLLLGITGTVSRHDGVGLDRVFEKISYQIQLRTLMETGPVIDGAVYPYLVPPKVYRVNTQVDMSSAKARKGDFLESDMSHLLDTPERNRLIVDKYLELGEGLPPVCFTVDVKHAHHVAEEFKNRGIRAAVVSGETSREERDRIYRGYGNGGIQALCSCSALGRGWDHTMATVALLARPTKSNTLYRQQIGRILRPSPSPEDYVKLHSTGRHPDWVKKHSIILDFCDLTGKHEIQTSATLFGLAPQFDMKGQKVTEAVKEIEALAAKQPGLDLRAAKDMAELRSQVDRIDLWRAPTVRPDVKRLSKFMWLELFEGVLQMQVAGGLMEIRQNTLGQFEIWQSRDGMRVLRDTQPELAAALTVADGMVPRDQEPLLRSQAKWRGHPPTSPQCGLLWRYDERIRKHYPRAGDFYQFAKKLYDSGNRTFSKGGISQLIDRVTLLRKKNT